MLRSLRWKVIYLVLLAQLRFNVLISNIIDLVKKKTDYDTKISDIETKYFNTSDYNKFMSEILDTKMKEKRLVNKSNISNPLKDFDLNTKLTTSAKKGLKAKKGHIVKLPAF